MQAMTRPEVCSICHNFSVTDHSLFTDRTSELRKKGYEGRRLGPVQMTTDTAVRVTRICVQDRSTIFLPACKLQLTLSSSRREDPIHWPPGDQDKCEREHRDAVPLRCWQGWWTYHAPGKPPITADMQYRRRPGKL